MNLYQVAEEIARRLANIFLKDKDGRRPVYGGTRKFQDDPHWRDCLLFYEYFHGDNGAGLGASHQTGWTGIIARSYAPVRDASRPSRLWKSARRSYFGTQVPMRPRIRRPLRLTHAERSSSGEFPVGAPP